MIKEVLAEEHGEWYSGNAKYHFKQGFLLGHKHGMDGVFTKEQIKKAMSKSYEHNSFNEMYFWSELEGK